MPGMFDDLQSAQGQQAQAPAGPSGMFEDLVPQATRAAEGQTFTGTVPVAEPPTYGGPSIIHALEGIYGAIKAGEGMASGELPIPQSANMPGSVQPGGESTSTIPDVTNIAAMMGPLAEAGQGFKLAAPTEGMLKQSASEAYDRAAKLPFSLKPELMGHFNDMLKTDPSLQGLFDPEIAPRTFNFMQKTSQIPPNAVGVGPVNLRTIQRGLGAIKDTSSDGTERMVAGRVLGQFNDLLENLDKVPSGIAEGSPQDAAQFSQLVKQANGDYGAYKNSQAFSQRGQNAEYQTHGTNSGMNLENNLRGQVTQILKNPKLQRGFSPDALQAMKDFNAGGTLANLSRAVGNIAGGGGGLGMLASGALSHMAGLPFEAGPAMGFALKSFGNKAALNKFGNIGDLLRANSPLAASGVTSRVPFNPLLSRLSVSMPILGLNPEPAQ